MKKNVKENKNVYNGTEEKLGLNKNLDKPDFLLKEKRRKYKIKFKKMC